MNRYAAYELFDCMRQSTPAEQKEYEKMLDKYSIPIGRSIWNMDIEMGYCDICHKYEQLQRKYYYYDIDCECCGGQHHFEIVKYCKNCAPKPPKRILAIVNPISE